MKSPSGEPIYRPDAVDGFRCGFFYWKIEELRQIIQLRVALSQLRIGLKKEHEFGLIS